MDGEPLDRFLARRTRWSWADVRTAIHRQRVRVDGLVSQHYHRRLAAASQVLLDGVEVLDAPDDAILLCHKPAGVACSHAPAHAPLVYDLVPPGLAHPDLQTVGRLDRDTTGLLVLTILGSLIQQLTSPRSGLPKRYRCRYRGRLADDAQSQLAQGMAVPATPEAPAFVAKPAELAQIAVGEEGGQATLILYEGKHHQVKRLFRALGAEITALHRDRIGLLDLPSDLASGHLRPATTDEIDALTVRACSESSIAGLGSSPGSR